jgi:hypothetical protein
MSTLPSKAAIFRAWMRWLDENGIDWGEPCCWACGEFWWGRYDPNPRSRPDDLGKIWEAAKPLERCHIIPRSLGGSDDPENLFLLCIDCHDRAPNTTSREAFLQWAKSQRGAWCKRRIEEIPSELEAFGLDDARRLEELIELLESSELRSWMRENAGLHWARSGKRGPRLTPSTLIVGLLEVRKQRAQNCKATVDEQKS